MCSCSLHISLKSVRFVTVISVMYMAGCLWPQPCWGPRGVTVTHCPMVRLTVSLQLVQNAAVHLFTGTRRCDHISHLLVQLHWLPVWRRVEYRVACLVPQALSGQAPAYLTDDINLVAESGRHLLRSAVDRTCVVPCTHNTYGGKSFTAACLRVWNTLVVLFMTRH